MRRAVAFLATLAVLAACGTIDGEDPYALWRVHEHPAGAFHFHYPAPPFDAAEGFTDAHPVMEVAPEDGDAAAWARYRLEARLTECADLDEAAAGEAAALADGGFGVGPPEPRWNRASDEGVEIRAGDGGIGAVVFLLRGEAGVVSISLAGTGDMEHPDVELLLDGFEPRSSGEH